jgi:hypothetical protein
MKARTLTALILICWLVLASAITGAHADEWYQGQPGSWHRHGNTWVWKGKHGDEWFEGKRGHWYAEPGGNWYWLGDDGREYRHGSHGWEWSGEHHDHHHHHHG